MRSRKLGGSNLQIGLIKVARRESSHRERMFPRKSPMCTPKELDVCRRRLCLLYGNRATPYGQASVVQKR